jgi:hypothetical protein
VALSTAARRLVPGLGLMTARMGGFSTRTSDARIGRAAARPYPDVMSRDREGFRPEPPRPFRGVGDPRYLLAEIEELRAAAAAAGLSSLAYQLQCAAAEARWHAEALDWAEDAVGPRSSTG